MNFAILITKWPIVFEIVVATYLYDNNYTV